MKPLGILAALSITFVMMSANVHAQSTHCPDQGVWNNNLTFPYGQIDAPFLLTDGRVMVQYEGTSIGHQHQDWYALTPDSSGNYSSGTWTPPPPVAGSIASLYNLWTNPTQYGPYGYASAVLADGRLLIEGGEVNLGMNQAFTWEGAIYDPATNAWSQLQPPPRWNGTGGGIGDAASVVLPDKTFMIAGCCSEGNQQAQLNPSTLQWTVLSNDGKVGGFFEEGWTLLPGATGGIFTIDTGADNQGNNHYELFDTTTKTWSQYPLSTLFWGDYPSDYEIGPAIQLTDGSIFATGAANGPGKFPPPTSPGNTGIYYPTTNSWLSPPPPSFPTFTQNYPTGMGDEMSVLLPDGNVLLAVHDSARTGTYYLMEYLPQTESLCSVNGASTNLTQNKLSSDIRMLVLPTGQVFITSYDFNNPSSAYYIYTPGSGTIDPSWRPVITSVASSLNRGSMGNQLAGERLHGLSQANMFGDDFQNATNWPLVQITNNTTHKLVYAKTHDHSVMGITTAGNTDVTTTLFDVPSSADPGQSTLIVVTNGISSNAVTVTIN